MQRGGSLCGPAFYIFIFFVIFMRAECILEFLFLRKKGILYPSIKEVRIPFDLNIIINGGT